MKIGFVGLGKMGGNMVERLLEKGHEIVVYDIFPEGIAQAEAKGAIAASGLDDLVSKLGERKAIWLMVPSGKPVDDNIALLMNLLKPEDIIIDGGNSYWRSTQERAAKAEEKGIRYVDCGTSGGLWGLQNGYCLMYGGEKEACNFLEPVFAALAPENGYVYCGTCGAGHMVKMIHNGIEYGMMQAYAEGFEIMKNSPFELDLAKVSQTWMQGSVVRSWLLELIGNVLRRDPVMNDIKDYVEDNGEGRWTVQTAMDFNVPAHVIAASLFSRFESRQSSSYAMKLLAALRNEFGGHEVKKE